MNTINYALPLCEAKNWLDAVVPPSKPKVDKIDENIEKAIAGNSDAFAILMEKHREKIFRLLMYMVHNRDDAMDLLQDTFLKAYKSISQLRNPACFYFWLARIATNIALNFVKKRDRLRKREEILFPECPAKTKNPMEILQKRELQETISQLIAELPAKQRIALVLCDIEGYSYKEIADILKCRIGTVMSRIYYARERLRQELVK